MRLGIPAARFACLLVAVSLLATAVPALASATKPVAEKKTKKKKCKSGYTLKTVKVKKGKKTKKVKKCVKKKVATTTPAPNPLSDADGDGLPYKWEAKPAAAATVKCKSGYTLKSGKCVKKCKKGYSLKQNKKTKKYKCIKKKKSKAKKSQATIRAVADTSLGAMGANPNRKDIFVQLNFSDSSVRQSLSCEGFDALYNAFATAPVSNPDGSTGITLHLDAGRTCPSRSYDLGGSQIFNAGACPNTGQIFNASQLPDSRVGAFHVAGLAPSGACGIGEGGAAPMPGTSMAVFTGGDSGWGMPFMHELGHNLGLDHGAPFSVMSGRQYFASSGLSSGTELIDYQRVDLPALDENNLSETEGPKAPASMLNRFYRYVCGGIQTNAWLGYGGVDWNCNSPTSAPNPPTFESGTVSADINNDGSLTVIPATTNEWQRLVYNAGGAIGH